MTGGINLIRRWSSLGLCKDMDGHRVMVNYRLTEKMKRVRDRVSLLLKGCHCKSGCKTRGDVAAERTINCGPGCCCTNCQNQGDSSVGSEENLQMHFEELEHAQRDPAPNYVEMDISELLEAVFGDENTDTESDMEPLDRLSASQESNLA